MEEVVETKDSADKQNPRIMMAISWFGSKVRNDENNTPICNHSTKHLP